MVPQKVTELYCFFQIRPGRSKGTLWAFKRERLSNIMEYFGVYDISRISLIYLISFDILTYPNIYASNSVTYSGVDAKVKHWRLHLQLELAQTTPSCNYWFFKPGRRIILPYPLFLYKFRSRIISTF